MDENFPNLGRYLDIEVNEVHRSPQNFNIKQSSQRHMIIKLSKTKNIGRNLKAVKEKNALIQGDPHKAINGFLSRQLADQKRVG